MGFVYIKVCNLHASETLLVQYLSFAFMCYIIVVSISRDLIRKNESK